MTTTQIHFTLRLATTTDIPILHELIESSVRGLQSNDYSPTQIEGALGSVLGLDTQLIADQTYFVVETENSSGNKCIVACGGWSNRKTLFGSDQGPNRESAFLDPATDAAKIRAFFVHPDWARRGLGSLLLETCENAAKSAGFTRFEMGSTLTGVALYKARGYKVIEPIEDPLRNGATLPVIRMSKFIQVFMFSISRLLWHRFQPACPTTNPISCPVLLGQRICFLCLESQLTRLASAWPKSSKLAGKSLSRSQPNLRLRPNPKDLFSLAEVLWQSRTPGPR